MRSMSVDSRHHLSFNISNKKSEAKPFSKRKILLEKNPDHFKFLYNLSLKLNLNDLSF